MRADVVLLDHSQIAIDAPGVDLHFAQVTLETQPRISHDITDRRRGEQTLNRRYAQLQATTDLGRLALRGIPLDELFRFAATCLCAVLDAPIVEISKARNDEMLLVGGAGWNDDV